MRLSFNSLQAFALAVALCTGRIVQGQHAAAISSAPSPVTSAADPFARYNTPNQCTMHAASAEQQYWRGRRPDTVYRAPWGNALQSTTVAEVRQCLSRFTVAAVPVRDLFFLGRGYILANEPARADSAFQRLLAARKSATVEQRAWILTEIVMAYIQAEPVQLAGATRYLAELDKLPATAAGSQMIAHTLMAQAANNADSVAMLGSEATAAVAAGRRIAGTDRMQRAYDELNARRALADWYVRRSAYDSARVVAKATVADLAGRRRWLSYGLESFGKVYDFLGGKSLPLERTWAYNNPDSATFPVTGKPTLIVFSSAGCEVYCYPGYAPMRRLAQKHGASGLRLVVYTETYGFFRNKLFTPSEEAERTRWYFLEYLKLPTAVLVYDAKFTVREDGIRFNVHPPGFESYTPAWLIYGSPTAVLVDKNGVVRSAGPLNDDTEARYDNLIAEMK